MDIEQLVEQKKGLQRVIDSLESHNKKLIDAVQFALKTIELHSDPNANVLKKMADRHIAEKKLAESLNPTHVETKHNILDCSMINNDIGVVYVREYLCSLLATLWNEEECFSGKRPFGNSGWKNDVYYSLVKNGVIPGTWHEEDCYADGYDKKYADNIIQSAIADMCGCDFDEGGEE